eukprot:15449849-Alexandrium_andersonii.AAC.1
MALNGPLDKTWLGANAQPDEAAAEAAPKGRTVLSKARNLPKVGDPPQVSAISPGGAARSAAS